MLFKTKEELMEAVQDHSIRHARREYYVTESSKTKWKVLCKHSTEGHVKCNPSYGIKHVIQNVKDQTGYDVPYQKAWYSLKMAREIVYGTWESSVKKLPAYLGAIQKYNPGTIVEWKHKGFQASTGKYVMGYVFWAFKPCIDGFQFCRNVISVDGTHLYTKYKYKLLIAAAMDGNQQVLPLAFAVVDEETYPSWKWFLQQLSRHVIRGRRGMCLISDRHGGLIKAVREGPDFVSPHGVHRYCLRHVCSNFNSTIKNVVLKDLCWQAGSEYQSRKFNRIMDEIKKQDVKAFAYLDAINKEKWTASHDGGWRCGILTTNMSECINGVLKGARRLPVSALVEITLERTVHYFHVRAIKGQKMLQNNQLWTDFACKMFISWQQKAVEHTVTKYSHAQQSASVVTRRQGRHGMNTHVVKIANRECSCGKWNQFGIPCSHAQKVCGAYNISAASMVKDYYDVMAYNNTYSKHFEPVQSEDYWDDPNFQLVHDPTIRTVTRPGRNQTTRIHNEMDWRQTRARQEAQHNKEILQYKKMCHRRIVDNTWNPGKSGAGGIFRDHNGCFLYAFSSSTGTNTNTTAELWALWTGLALAQEKGLKTLTIETDSKALLHLFRRNKEAPRHLIPLLRDCRTLWDEFHNVQIGFCYRKVNRAADSLAKYAATHPFCNYQFSSCPVFSEDILYSDSFPSH
ncbi:UNVERIFIED_CONTAM: hypothetical protein Sradi_1330600 [Sesamum radiatum]|uniref:SWIM-type domain-containing protein n=1 Tax=Sesamum radiatum TaxID=300843 RepID=A0AAW2UV18_SESRA